MLKKTERLKLKKSEKRSVLERREATEEAPYQNIEEITYRTVSHLFADVSTFLRSQLLQPISLDLIKVALDSRLERLVLPDGCRAEGAACELTWR